MSIAVQHTCGSADLQSSALATTSKNCMLVMHNTCSSSVQRLLTDFSVVPMRIGVGVILCTSAEAAALLLHLHGYS